MSIWFWMLSVIVLLLLAFYILWVSQAKKMINADAKLFGVNILSKKRGGEA